MKQENPNDPRRRAIIASALIVPLGLVAPDDADAWAERLDAHDVEYRGPLDRPDGARQIFLRDPDDHVIELLEPAD